MIDALSCLRIAIPEEREEMAREFYGDVLGLTEVEPPAELAAPAAGNGGGGLWYRVADGLFLFLAPDKEFVPTHITHPIFGVASRDDALTRFEEYMFEVEWPREAGRSNEFYVYDPFGNRVAFHERAYAAQQ